MTPAVAGSLFKSLERIPDPRRRRGVKHPFQALLRLTLLGLVSGQTTMAHPPQADLVREVALADAAGAFGL